MKTTMKKAMTLCLLAAIALSGFGCSKKEAEQMPVETISLDQTKQELTFDFKTGVVDDTIASQDAVEDTGDATEGAAETAEDTKAAETTKQNGGEDKKNVETVVEEVTQVMNVTDAEGHGVTDAAGEPATEMAVVDTRVIEVPVTDAAAETAETAAEDATEEAAAGNEAGNEAPAETPAPTEAPTVIEYKPAYDTCKAYWLDMSKAGDYSFNGEFLTFTFQINEDIPDGSYPLSISKTDIASWEEVRYYPEIINGEIAVNQSVSEQKDMPDDKFSLKINSAEAKQGQTVTVTVDLENNPGFCGFVIDLQYDANAMTIIEAGGGKDYDEAVHVNK